MKTKNTLKPALLESDEVKSYVVKINLNGGRWAELEFSGRDMARDEFNRIKAAGIYCGAWVDSMALGEKILTAKETK